MPRFIRMSSAAWPIMLSMLLRFVRVATLMVSTTVGTISGQAGAKVPWAVSVDPLRSPAGPNSAQPQLSAAAQGPLLSWIEREGQKTTLRFAERTATGWSAARDVSSGTDWFVNWADVPSVVRLASGELVAHWLQKSKSDSYAYDVRLSYSKDDGRTWPLHLCRIRTAPRPSTASHR